MAYLVDSDDVRIGCEITIDTDPIEFHGGRVIGKLPTLYDSSGKYVEPVNQWFIYLIGVKRHENISSYSRALLSYWRFLEENRLTWNVFPVIKSLKPTYRFRNQHLLKKAKEGDLAFSTANTYIRHVVQFYKWAAHEQLITITGQNKPFEIEIVNIKNESMLAHMMPKFTVQTSDLRIRVPRSSQSNRIRSMNPLSQKKLAILKRELPKASTETGLIILLGLLCGLRKEEASSLTIEALSQAYTCGEADTRFNIPIGPDNGVQTKNNKKRTIEISSSLINILNEYAISDRRMIRLKKLHDKTESDSNSIQKWEPLFISQQGNPMSPESVGSRFCELRMEIKKTNADFNHEFHDFRRTYATYRLQSLLDIGIPASQALSLIMSWMGHEDERTTWKYLSYLKRNEALVYKISMLDQIMHDSLKGYA